MMSTMMIRIIINDDDDHDHNDADSRINDNDYNDLHCASEPSYPHPTFATAVHQLRRASGRQPHGIVGRQLQVGDHLKMTCACHVVVLVNVLWLCPCCPCSRTAEAVNVF